jgi:RNA polymerase sigma-70 factor (ECF subfamily)
MDEAAALVDLSVAELVERFRTTAAADCFAELYRRTRRRVFGVALRLVADPALAEEICHDAFLRAYEGFASLRGVEFSAWVCRIAENLALNARRHRAVVERARADLAKEPAAPGPERHLISRQEVEIAGAILASLRPEQRDVLLLRHLERLSHGEICAVTGHSPAEVRSHLQNARRNFAIHWRRRTAAGVEDDG